MRHLSVFFKSSSDIGLLNLDITLYIQISWLLAKLSDQDPCLKKNILITGRQQVYSLPTGKFACFFVVC